MIHIHKLNGCAPTPLAHYLKALGILRLVSENKVHGDPDARGWWEGERFLLASKLDRAGLESFFLEWYEPTPMVAPWNGGTGFYPKDKKAKRAIEGLIGHASPRFEGYRNAISVAQNSVEQRVEAPEKKEKDQFIASCLRYWRGQHHEAMAAAVVLNSVGKPGYPSLFGTGFNDGRLDFTSNFMGRLMQLFPDEGAPPIKTVELLQEVIWKIPVLGMDTKGAIGQFMPGSAGGANSGAGPTGDPFSNPWDFILMLEGTLIFTAHATRRLGATEQSRVAAPFAVSAQGAGYASSSDADESARGEQWMPLWSQPMKFEELKRLFAEGRAQIGVKAAHEPLDLARAVARLGTARGISAFQRYGYIERNGQSNLAVPIGRFYVPAQVSPRITCLDDLEIWLPRLRREARDDHAPVRLKQTEHQLADALFAVTQHPEESSRWQTVLLALSDVEALHVKGGNFRAGPIPKLRPEWVQAAGVDQAEMRLALAFALQAAGHNQDGGRINSIRRHWLPIKNEETAAVMHARNGITDAIALVERRLIEASQHGIRQLPLVAGKVAANSADLAAWTSGEIDTDRTLALARALMALDSHALAKQSLVFPRSNYKVSAYPDDAWLVLRLAFLPWPLKDGRRINCDPAIFRRLVSGDAASAVDLALRRLRTVGIKTSVRTASVPPETARLWAAALAFPIHRNTAENFLHRLDPTTHLEN